MNEPAAERKTRVFLSYSRKDGAFTRGLADALAGRGYVVDFDRSEVDPDSIDTGISAEDEWWRRLQQMIAASDTMVFVVSPDSAASKVCDEEIVYARTLGKRVIPILQRPIDFAAAPPRLAALNVKLSFVDEAKFAASLGALCAALDLDIAWHREGARLTSLASKWDQDGRPDAQVLSEGGVADADRWAARRPTNVPAPGELVMQYIDAGRAKATGDRDRLLANIGRAYVKPAEEAVTAGKFDAALRIAAAGMILSEDQGMRLVPERAAAALRAAAHNRLRVAIPHAESVETAAFSPDGQRLVTTSASSGWVWVWEASSGHEILVLRGHEGRATEAVFSADGKTILTTSLDKTARIWDAVSGKELKVFKGEHFIGPLDAIYGNDGARIATMAHDHCRLWDVRSGRVLSTWSAEPGRQGRARRHDDEPIGRKFDQLVLGFSPDLKRVVTATSGSAQLKDAASGEIVANLSPHIGPLDAAVFSRDGSRILLFSELNMIVHDATGRKLTSLSAIEGVFRDAELSPDGTRIAIIERDQGAAARVWDIDRDREVVTLKGPQNSVSIVAFAADGGRVLTVDRHNHTVSIWDAADGAHIAELRGHERKIVKAAFSADGTRVLTGSLDGSVRLWDAAGDGVMTKLASAWGRWDVPAAGFSRDGQRVCTARSGEPGAVWDVASGRGLTAVDGVALAFDSQGKRVIASDENTAAVIDIDSGTRRELRGQEGYFKKAAFSPDGARVATPRGVWNAADGRLIAALQGSHCAAFSPDGRRVVTDGGHHAMSVCDASSGAELVSLRGHDGEAAVYSPDGARILTWSDQSVRLWDSATGTEIAPLFQPEAEWEGRIESAAFTSDGARIVVLTQSGSGARVFDAESQRELAAFVGGGPSVVEEGAVSPDGTLLYAQGRDAPSVLYDVASNCMLATMPTERMPGGAAFSADGLRLITAYGGGASVRDLSQFAATSGDVAEALAASLANGCGRRTWQEAEDLLMRSAPEDLYEALLEWLTPQQRENVARRSALLSRPRHPNCYLAPSQRPGYQPSPDATHNAELSMATAKAASVQQPIVQPPPQSPAPTPAQTGAGPRRLMRISLLIAALLLAAALAVEMETRLGVVRDWLG